MDGDSGRHKQAAYSTDSPFTHPQSTTKDKCSSVVVDRRNR
jgi:hypothetical protein